MRLRLIEVTYELLPPVMDVEEAMKESAPVLHEDMYTTGYDETPSKASNIATRVEMKMGDVDAGFADADVIVEREFRTPTAHQGYIEPHACTVTYERRWAVNGLVLHAGAF